jgi:hypothetical protein
VDDEEERAKAFYRERLAHVDALDECMAHIDALDECMKAYARARGKARARGTAWQGTCAWHVICRAVSDLQRRVSALEREIE